MIDLYFKEYELGVMKVNNIYESAIDQISLETESMKLIKSQGYYMESDDNCDEIYEETTKVLTAAKNFFESLIKEVQTLIQKTVMSVRLELAKRDANKRLAELKKALVAGRINKSDKVRIFDTAKYMKNFTDYINTYTTSINKLYGKTYASTDEFEDAINRFAEDLEEKAKKLKLTDEERDTIFVTLENAIKLTESEISNMDSINKLYEKNWVGGIKLGSKLTSKFESNAAIGKIKVSVNKFSTECATTFKKISHSPLAKLAAIASVAAAATAGGVAIKNGKDAKYLADKGAAAFASGRFIDTSLVTR